MGYVKPTVHHFHFAAAGDQVSLEAHFARFTGTAEQPQHIVTQHLSSDVSYVKLQVHHEVTGPIFVGIGRGVQTAGHLSNPYTQHITGWTNTGIVWINGAYRSPDDLDNPETNHLLTGAVPWKVLVVKADFTRRQLSMCFVLPTHAVKLASISLYDLELVEDWKQNVIHNRMDILPPIPIPDLQPSQHTFDIVLHTRGDTVELQPVAETDQQLFDS